MDEPTLENLARRLARLERENRWLKRIGTLLTVGAAAGVLMGQMPTTTATVESQRFVVRDAAGQTRAVLGATADGSIFEMYDKDGERRAAMGIATDGSATLSLLPKGEKGGVWVSARPYGWSNLQVFDRGGASRLAAGVAADGATLLVINDSGGTSRAGLGVAADDRPFRFP
jgi:hypothetical protein